jgi:hypothetical protein
MVKLGISPIVTFALIAGLISNIDDNFKASVMSLDRKIFTTFQEIPIARGGGLNR